jgi:hypothetical protein
MATMAPSTMAPRGGEAGRSADRAGASEVDAALAPPWLLRAITPPLSQQGCHSRTPSTGMSSPRQCRAPIRQPAVRLRANGRGLFPLQIEVSEAGCREFIDAFEASCEEEATSPDLPPLEARFWEPQVPVGPFFLAFTAVLPAQRSIAAVAVADARPAAGAAAPPPPLGDCAQMHHPSCERAVGLPPHSPTSPMDLFAPGDKRPLALEWLVETEASVPCRRQALTLLEPPVRVPRVSPRRRIVAAAAFG